ncbi:MAG: Hsp20/alpha crystallin family protein [Candidatus Marinimicrobia bacterium]|nr:Hsp20/alpha crystallin family protein [Candidatus Neomarinimicrobiota bacterium]
MIDLTLLDGLLTISGKCEERPVNEAETVHTTELRHGKFGRSFTLPTEVDEQEVMAKYANGILSMSLNKLAPVERDKTKIVVK